MSDIKNMKGPKITWRSTVKQDSVMTVNRFSKAAVQFIFPLFIFEHFRGRHLDLEDSDHILLGKILWSIAQMISLATASPSLIQVVSATFLALRRARGNQHLFVLNACQFCYLTIFESVSGDILKQAFPHELQDCLSWLEGMRNTKQYDGDETLKRTTHLIYEKMSTFL